NVWATWCAPCRAETPALIDIQNQYRDRGLKVVGVSVDESGLEQVKDFVRTERINYDVAFDPEGRIATLVQTTELPVSLVIDRGGHLLWRASGAISRNEPGLVKAIENALPK